mgnify:CR=1 FL=1
MSRLKKDFKEFLENDFKHLVVKVERVDAKQKLIILILGIILTAILVK